MGSGEAAEKVRLKAGLRKPGTKKGLAVIVLTTKGVVSIFGETAPRGKRPLPCDWTPEGWAGRGKRGTGTALALLYWSGGGAGASQTGFGGRPGSHCRWGR